MFLAELFFSPGKQSGFGNGFKLHAYMLQMLLKILNLYLVYIQIVSLCNLNLVR